LATALRVSRHRVGRKRGRRIIHGILVLLALGFIMPFMLVISASLSDNDTVLLHGYRLWPVKFSLEAYRFLFLDPHQLLTSYRVSIVITAVGTIGGLLISSMLAYALSRRGFRLRGPFSFLVYFTILFSGGVVPYYILMTRYLHLQDNILALILPGLLSPWYVLLLRTYFRSLPGELLDAAKVDGANEFQIFFRIALPLSKPALVTIGLFYILAYWNNWFSALLFIRSPDLSPLQYTLYRVMADLQFLTDNMSQLPGGAILPRLPMATTRMALAVLGAAPVVVIFGFLQKYFVGGLTVGAFKGGAE